MLQVSTASRSLWLLALLGGALCVPAQAWADSTVVIRPTGSVSKKRMASITRVIDSKVASLAGVVVSDVDVSSECFVDPSCLASAGRDDGVTTVVGVHVSKSRATFTLLFMAVDASTGLEIARERIRKLTRKNIDKRTERALVAFIGKLGTAVEEPPVEVPPEPPVEVPPEPPVEEPVAEPVKEGPPAASVAKKATPTSPPLADESQPVLGLGISVGEPMRLTASYRLPILPLAIEIGMGSGVVGGTGLHLDAHLSYERALGPVQLKLGAGYRYYRHDYDPTVDEVGSDLHQGVQGLVGVSYSLGLFDLFGEFMPGYDLAQSASCTFMSGVNTECPHQDESRLYFNLGVGARYWIKM